jgi:hypothetical protein
VARFSKKSQDEERNDKLEELIVSLTAILAIRYQQLYVDISAFFSEERIRDWLQSGFAGGISQQIPDDLIAAYFPDMFAEIQRGLIDVGDIEADFAKELRDWSVPLKSDPASEESQVALNEVRDSASEFFLSDIRSSADRSIAAGVATGLSVAAIAENLRRDIGLTPWQQQAVENYRNELINQERAALRRALRDERYDRTLEAYIDGKLQLSERKINQMVGSYRENMKLQRAKAAGQIYATGIVNSGVSAFWKRAVRLGLISPDRLKKYWINRGDEKVRHSHRQIPFLNAGGVQGMDAPFQSPLGAIRYPGDPSASLANRAGCRCILRVSPQ